MATAGSAIVVLVLCARAQTSSWRSSESLWTHALAHTSGNALAHCNLGTALMDSGRVEEAMPHLRAALALIPHYPEARANLGNALLAKGHVHEGMAHYRRALKVDPGHANAALGLANALARLGRGEDAIARYRQAIASAPDNVIAHNNLGNALLGAGQADEALQQFRTALDIDPQFALAENNLASALLQAGALDEAVAHYRRALEIDPRYAEAHHNLGLALFRTGRGQEAMASYRTALALRPDYPDAHNNLAVACMAGGRMDEAIAHYRQALAGQPESVMTLTNLAYTLAAGPDVLLRRPTEALELAQRAVQLSRGRNAEALRTLAIAYGEVGRVSTTRSARAAMPSRWREPTGRPRSPARWRTSSSGCVCREGGGVVGQVSARPVILRGDSSRRAFRRGRRHRCGPARLRLPGTPGGHDRHCRARAERYLQARGPRIDPLMTYVLSRLERRYGLAWTAEQRDGALAAAAASPQLGLFRRLVDPHARPDPGALATIANQSDRLILSALYCRELGAPPAADLETFARKPGADVAHGALALQWLVENRMSDAGSRGATAPAVG